MNTDALAKQYDKLTPQERFPLILAAVARDDEAEQNRLTKSAPRSCYSLPDYFAVGDTFLSLSKFHFMLVLDLAAKYFEAFASVGPNRKQWRRDLDSDWYGVMLSGYAFKTYLAGWHKFCAGLKVDPEVLWRLLPGFETVLRAERASEANPQTGLPGAAFTAEGVGRYLARTTAKDPEAEVDEATLKKFSPVTGDDVAASLQAAFEHGMEKWN